MLRTNWRWWFMVSWVVVLSACRPAVTTSGVLPALPTWTPAAGLVEPESLPRPVATPPPNQPPVESPQATLVTSPAPGWRVRVAANAPAGLHAQVVKWGATSGAARGWSVVADPAGADVTLSLGTDRPVGDWIYAVVAAFPTLTDDVSEATLQQRWLAVDPPALVVEAGAIPALTLRWGAPGPQVEALPLAAIPDRLWQGDGAWGIVPLEGLTPALKLLTVNGVSPLAPTFTPATYSLTLPVTASGAPAAVQAWHELWPAGGLTNWDSTRLTRVALTGVTALVRATAYAMEQQGVLFPGEEVAAILQAADIAHVSNEVAFTPDCPYPNPIGGTTFCSHDRYFELLTFIGADVVELTGNHVNDWGLEAFNHTLDRYAGAGMHIFGGGRNLAEASRPALLEHRGNRLAFVGCNPVGPAYAWAGAETPGSRPCDADLAAQIGQLAAEGYLVIATLQYHEYYTYAPLPQQQHDFRALIDAGAAIVSGSQGHHAQGFELYQGGFIHYGLGNLFFDQMDMMGTRQSFIDIYTLYEGRLINVELVTGLIEFYARPRLMTAEERAAVLQAVFEASGWRPQP